MAHREYSEAEFEELNKEWQSRLQKLPRHEQIIASTCAGHLSNGAYWGFDSDINASFRDIAREIASEGYTRVAAVKLARGGLVQCQSLADAVQVFRKVTGPEFFDDESFERANRAIQTSYANLKEFCEAGKAGTVGFYNTNKTDTITFNSKTYPSFKLTGTDFFGMLAHYGYMVENKAGERVPASSLSNAGNMVKFLEGCEKAPSSNSILVRIAR